MNEIVANGIYQHYKGRFYRVIGTATHTETGEELVVYEALYGENKLWVRPKQMFLDTVEIDGRTERRFSHFTKGDIENLYYYATGGGKL